MSQDKNAGFLPGWTMLLPLVGCFVALAILWACRDSRLSFWIGVPTAIVVVIGGILLERTVERKYLTSRRNH